jgi:putative DNA primase/helicase
MDITDEQRKALLTAEVDHEGHSQCVLVLYGGKFKCTTTHGWMRYNGRYWEQEGAEQAVERAITNTLIKRRELYASIEEWKRAKLCASWRQNVTGTKAQLAKSSSIFVSISEFDKSPDHVNCKNGVVDLRTGEIEPHNPTQLFTYCLTIEYHKELEKRADLWLEFLFSCGLSAEVIEYMRLGFGYSLTGHTWEEVMFYLFGMTRSGKGTTMETVNLIMGMLSTGVDMETFTSKRYGDTSNFDLAPLKNKRFITASESQRRGQLNPAFIKKVTGGDDIYCSFKRRDHFSYRPQFKIWLTSNFEANTDVDDDAAWGRLRVIHYPKSFLGSEDKTLKKRLQAPESLNAIFAWMVSGAIDWYKQGGKGLPMPEEVAQKTREHREALDSIAQFVEQQCIVKDDAFVVGSQLHSAYKRWCDDEGYTAVGRKRFTQSLASKGIDAGSKKISGATKRGYIGIGLLYDEV